LAAISRSMPPSMRAMQASILVAVKPPTVMLTRRGGDCADRSSLEEAHPG
jgi:hypothetical protein